MFRDPICCVTVSVNYGDILAESAKWNRHFFDKWVIVTHPDDLETREVARRNKLTCLTTEDQTRDGVFSKGRLIERGLQQLPADSWIMHMDADIVLPATFRHDLERADLQEDTIYGFDRFMVKSYEKWQELVKQGWPQGKFYGHPHTVNFPWGYEIGSRWVGPDGWCPIGFATIHHRKGSEEEWRGSRVRSYPLLHGSSCRTDLQFSHLWDRKKRGFIPEIVAAHIESEPGKVGINWKGRQSKRFGPPLEPVTEFAANLTAPS